MTNVKKILKIGVIGRGIWGQKIIKVLKKNFKIQFVIGKDTNYKEIKKKIDWVFVLTTNNTHYKICKYFLNSGINVFCEKPLTTSLKEANELYYLSKKNKVNLYVDDIEIFKNKKLKIKKNNKILRKKFSSGRNYSLFERLCYHDLYLIYKYVKNKKIKKIKFFKSSDLLFKINFNNLIFNFEYSIKTKEKIHKINNSNFLKFKDNPMQKMIINLIQNKKFSENKKRSLFALKVVSLLKFKYKKR